MTRTIPITSPQDTPGRRGGNGVGIQERLLEVLSHTNTAVAIFDAAESCTFCSPLFEQVLCCIPSNIDALVAGLSNEADTQHHLRRTFEAARNRQQVSEFEVSYAEPSGAKRVLSVDAFLCGDEDDAELAVIIKNTSGELSLRRDLEQISRLAALGQITAGVAHEFNNIITSILGWSQIAAENTEIGEGVTSALEIIKNNARRAKDIASHLLGVSRSKEDAYAVFSVVQVVEDVLKLLSWEMNRGSIQLERSYATDEHCMGNENRISQVFINIMRNAMDAMPDGGRLSVSVTEENGHVVASFKDSGSGMEQGVLGQIFDPFFTTKSGDDKESHGGSGLGLALCRDILEQHGGRIEVESAPEKGTKFSVLIPVTFMNQLTENGNGTPRPSIPPGISVLVVDDEPDIGEMIRTALELKGAKVLSAQYGRDAVDVCQKNRFDVAFIDFTMPGLSGNELGRKLLEIQKDLKIIFMSGKEIEMEDDIPIVDFVKKPFDLDDIQSKLVEISKDRQIS
ncbi:MAG: hybrid sensor histidine kinase/response regulator [Proteobacteria bacterium]|nr:hybrid sensor histidine kinase/response regulator [Pseudomonadota bacterium]